MAIRQLFIGTAACLALAAPAWAINKCTAADGKVSFQDAPCANSTGEKVEVRLSSSGVDTSIPDRTPPNASSTPSKEGAFGPTWRRKTDLEQRLIRDARNDLQAHQQRCAVERRDFAATRTQARTAMSVAKSEQALAAEIQAVFKACDARTGELQAKLVALEKELQTLNKK